MRWAEPDGKPIVIDMVKVFHSIMTREYYYVLELIAGSIICTGLYTLFNLIKKKVIIIIERFLFNYNIVNNTFIIILL